jgi:hypothetical protein
MEKYTLLGQCVLYNCERTLTYSTISWVGSYFSIIVCMMSRHSLYSETELDIWVGKYVFTRQIALLVDWISIAMIRLFPSSNLFIYLSISFGQIIAIPPLHRNNAHDYKLKNIVKENTLLHSDALSTQPTFFHHNGNSTSQIDYISSSGSFINKNNILRQHATNTSTNVPVVAELCRCLPTSIQKSRINMCRNKIVISLSGLW